MYVYERMCVCMYVCLGVCICVCMYVYKNIDILCIYMIYIYI